MGEECGVWLGACVGVGVGAVVVLGSAFLGECGDFAGIGNNGEVMSWSDGLGRDVYLYW